MPNTYKKIASAVVGSGGSNTITFNSIPQTYKDLKVVVSSRLTDNNGQTWSDYALRFNSSTSNYNGIYFYGNGASALSGSDASYINARTNAAGQTASVFGSNEFYISNYTSSNFKNVNIDTVSENNNTTSINMIVASLWSSTDPVTRIDLVGLYGNFAQHTTATLYGIEDVTTSKFAKAVGGVITYDANYVYHTYPYSGTFTPNTALTVDYLVVAGGGAGGGPGVSGGGGGGAGGVRCTVGQTGGGGSLESPLSLSSGSAYTVTIGAGGAANNAGNNSVFASITSTAGGRGKDSTTGANSIGGSGGGGNGTEGGGGAGNKTGAVGTANQGFAGGDGFEGAGANARNSGGGGGAGSVGTNAGQSLAGNGGSGITTSISGISTVYAGGGGGGVGYGTRGTGTDGGGNGGNGSTAGGAGTANTGSGGGGGGRNESTGATQSPGAGGSGIVIIRYPR